MRQDPDKYHRYIFPDKNLLKLCSSKTGDLIQTNIYNEDILVFNTEYNEYIEVKELLKVFNIQNRT